MQNFNELKLFLQSLPKLNDKNADERVAKAKENFNFFVRTYLGHHIGQSDEFQQVKISAGFSSGQKDTSIFRRWVYEELPNLVSKEGEVSLSYFRACEVSSERSALGVRERSEKQTARPSGLRSKKEPKRQSANKICIKAYRGAAKTTLMRLFSLWLILRGDKRYAIFIGSTQDLAKETIDLLKTELEDNANLVLDFGIKIGSVWSAEELVFQVQTTQNQSHLCKIKSFGAGKKIRGTNFLSMRPDLIICDDIENDENIESKTQRDKLYSWFNKAILKLPSRLNKHYNIIIVGTTLHYDSLLQRLDKRDDFQSFSFPLVLEFPQNLAELLQNGDFDKAKGLKLDDSSLDSVAILTDLAQDRSSFFSEFQNLPLDRENAPLANYTTFSELPRNVDAIFIGIDPALGKKKGDYFALSQLYYTKAQKKLFWAAQGFKISPDKMLDKIIALYLRVSKVSNTITIACEEVAFQEFFKIQLKARFNALGIFVPIVGIKNTTNKEVRLDALAPLLKDESILVDENAALLREELDSYPKCAHDDLLDSGEIALRAFNHSSRTDYKGIHAMQKDYKARFSLAKNRI